MQLMHLSPVGTPLLTPSLTSFPLINMSECNSYCLLVWGDAGRAGAMEVNVLPLSITTVPHAGLLGLHGARHAAAVHVLGQPNVGDTRCIFTDKVHMWVQEDGMHRLIPFGQRCKWEITDYWFSFLCRTMGCVKNISLTWSAIYCSCGAVQNNTLIVP